MSTSSIKVLSSTFYIARISICEDWVQVGPVYTNFAQSRTLHTEAQRSRAFFFVETSCQLQGCPKGRISPDLVPIIVLTNTTHTLWIQFIYLLQLYLIAGTVQYWVALADVGGSNCNLAKCFVSNRNSFAGTNILHPRFIKKGNNSISTY